MGLVGERAEIRSYDFQRPHQLNQLQLDAIALIMESYLRAAASFLSTYLRTPVQMQLVSAGQTPFEQYADAVASPTILTVASQLPLPGTFLVECPIEVALAMIDRALGGPGAEHYPLRELTEIEQTIFQRVMQRLLDLYGKSWNAILAFEPKIETVEQSPAFAQIAGEGDLVAIVKLHVQLDGHRGLLTWVWPYATVSPFAAAVGKHGWGREEGEEVEPRPEDMARLVAGTTVPVQVIWGRTELTMGEWQQLKVGDVVVLETRYDKPLPLTIGGLDKYYVLPGRYRGRLATRVIGRMENGG